MKFKSIFLFSLILLSRTVVAQLTADSLLIEGHYRTFHFQKPAPGKDLSLVFVLHGSGGDGPGVHKSALALDAVGVRENVVFVYPSGYKRYWNECRKAATSLANVENINDNAFFAEMIRYFEKRYNVNARQVFAVGTSGGGHMAYKLALTMPDKFRAITAIIANLPTDANMDCAPAGKPVNVLIINGTLDPLNPYAGGEMRTGNVYLGMVRSTDETFKYWAGLDRYTGQPVKTILPDSDPTDGKTIEKYVYQNSKKHDVVLLKVINGKHDYPNDIDVHLEAWAFFKSQLTREKQPK